MSTGAESGDAGYADYADELAELLAEAGRERSRARIGAALDGGAARAFRERVELDVRREAGAFFTGRALANCLLADGLPEPRPLTDAAAGAGDLLLAAARQLPVGHTVQATLRGWGHLLQARELDPVLVRAMRLRLALLAGERLDKPARIDEAALAELLPQISVGDGLRLNYKQPVTLLLNPPFGSVMEKLAWGEGRLGRAAVFTARCVEALPAGSMVRAILPDVLRSGSNYARWRAHMATMLASAEVKPYGQFDAWTDVDVFTLAATCSESRAPIVWWPEDEAEQRVEDRFEVRVGAVVPHRDPKQGEESPFICAQDLSGEREHLAGTVRRRHEGRRFRAPFVAVRRTSRPAPGGRRVPATIVRCKDAVLAENHLLICRPRDGSLRSCRELVDLLASARAGAWLDARIRCRHLTVRALGELPL